MLVRSTERTTKGARMDLGGITGIRFARSRADLVLAEDEAYLAGGSWLYSEPQPKLHTLVDLATLDWPAISLENGALQIAATCTLAELSRLAPGSGWNAHPL